MDPVLQDILKGGVTKHLEGTQQTKCIVNSKSKPRNDYLDQIRQFRGKSAKTNKVETDDYWRLQRNQEAIRWDNLLQGKFSKDWRKLRRNYTKKKKASCKQHEQQRKQQEEHN